jgi:DNA repair exonuclease SbcCD ATPase subunit
MILFKYIRWKNILSTGNNFTEIKLNKSKSTLIVGENGSGKSTILDALSWSLYGKAFRKVNKVQMINSINGKGAEVQVEFAIGKDNYQVNRTIKKYGSSMFEIYKNDKLVDQSANSRDYQEHLERQILKMNHRSFCQIVVLGSATFMPFMQLSAQHRREVIEDLLDIEIFTTMNTLLKEKVSTNKDSLQQVVYNTDILNEKIDLQNQYLKTVKDDNDKRIQQHHDKIEKSRNEIQEYQQQIEQLNTQVAELNGSIADKDSVSKKKKKIEQLEVKIKSKMSSLVKEIEFFDNHDNCPTCKQDIDHEFKCSTIEAKNTTLEDTTVGFEQLQREYYNITERLEEINSVQEQVNNLLTEINSNNSHINAINQMIGSIQKDIDQLQSEDQDTSELSGKLDELNQQLEACQTRREELSTEKSVLDIAQLILKDSGIKTKIIKQYVPVMNKLINKYLAAMDFFVQFELDENFNETIKSRFRDEFSYASFSEGEKMRIDLALLFTWRAIAKLRNSVSTNLLIMDEVFDSSLDTTGTEEFIKILNTLVDDANIFIISHKGDQLFDRFHSVIKFEKVKNFSRMVA